MDKIRQKRTPIGQYGSDLDFGILYLLYYHYYLGFKILIYFIIIIYIYNL